MGTELNNLIIIENIYSSGKKIWAIYELYSWWTIKAGTSASSAQKNTWLEAWLCHKVRLVSSFWTFHFTALSLHHLFPPSMFSPAHASSVQFSFFSTNSCIFWNVSKGIFCSENNFGSKRGKKYQKIAFLLACDGPKNSPATTFLPWPQKFCSLCCDLRNSAVFAT